MAIICQILFCFVHCKRAADLVASRRLGAALDMKAEKIKVLLNVLSIDGLLANRPLFNESPGVFDMTGCPPLRRIFFIYCTAHRGIGSCLFLSQKPYRRGNSSSDINLRKCSMASLLVSKASPFPHCGIDECNLPQPHSFAPEKSDVRLRR